MVFRFFRMVLIGLFMTVGIAQSYAADEVVVYSARKEHLIQPVFAAYTAETGIKVTYLTGKAAALLQRIKAEGNASPADVFLTVDAGNLWHAAESGVLQPVRSKVLEKNIPAHLRDDKGRWFGLSVRARTIVYHPDRVKAGTLSTYEALADPVWKDRLVLRTSKKVYNQSLVAMMIAAHGEKETETIVKGWVGNLAAPPFGNDTKTMEAIASGVGDVGIVNTYYFGRLKRKQPDLKLALFWPNQETGGVHVNVSGGGVTRHAPHPEAALQLLEWLATEKAQRLFADLNMEYPANPDVAPAAEVAAWGSFQKDTRPLIDAGRYQADAVRLMDRAGYK